MKRVLIGLVFVICFVHVQGQVVVDYATFSEYSKGSPTYSAVVRDTMYLSHTTGFVSVFDDSLRYVRMCVELDRYFIDEIFSYADHLWAVTRDKQLMVRTSDTSWTKVADIEAYCYRDSSNTMFILEGGFVKKLQMSGDNWTATPIATAPQRNVWTFAVVGDTVIYSFDSTNVLSVCDVDGSIINEHNVPTVVERLYALSDGSVAIRSSSVAHVIRSGGILSNDISYVPSEKWSYLKFPMSDVAHGRVGITGQRADNTGDRGNYPSYFLYHADSMKQIPFPVEHNASDYAGSRRIVRASNSWYSDVAGSTVQKLSDEGELSTVKNYDSLNRNYKDNRYQLFSPKENPTTLRPAQLWAPRSAALVQINGDRETQRIDTVLLIDTALGVKYFLNYSYNPDGSLCCFTDRCVLYRESITSQWIKTFTYQEQQSDYPRTQYSFFNLGNGLHAVADNFYNQCTFSTDGGRTWPVFGFDGHNGNISDLSTHIVANGMTVYIYDQQSIRQYNLTDSVLYLDSTDEQNQIHYRKKVAWTKPAVLMSADSTTLKFLSWEGTGDDESMPQIVQKLMYCTWKPLTQEFDIQRVELENPIDLSWYHSQLMLNVFVDNDTVHVVNPTNLQYLKVFPDLTYSETTLDCKGFHSVDQFDSPTFTFDPQGILWMSDQTTVTSLAFNVRGRNVTDVDDNAHDEINQGAGADVVIYPNPAADVINVQVSESGPLSSITVIDLFGRIVIESSHNRIDVSQLANGQYIAIVKSDMFVRSRTFVVNR